MDLTGFFTALFLGLFLFVSLAALFRKPIALLLRLGINTAMGFGALALVRATASLTGITLGLNLFNAAAIGILGLPGLVLLLLSQWVFS